MREMMHCLCEIAAKAEVSGCSERFHSIGMQFPGFIRTAGTAGLLRNEVKNRKAGCFTLLKRITNIKCVNSEVKSVKHLPHKGGSLTWVHGTMSESPWKSH